MANPKEVFRFIGRSSRRVGITILGGALVATGLFLIIFPGPFTIPLIIAGLAVLATEYAWARRALDATKERARRLAARMRARRAAKHEGTIEPPGPSSE